MASSIVDRTTLTPEFEHEYGRFLKELGTEELPERQTVSAATVLHVHMLLAETFSQLGEGLGGVGPRSSHLLQSAVSRQHVGFDGQRKWADLYHIAGTLFFGLIKNHPFHDGNKRTALLTALYQLECNNRVVSVGQSEFEELTVRVADGTLHRYAAFGRFRNQEDQDVRFIAWFLQRNTRQVNKREYRVSYRQLDRILRRFGFYLGSIVSNRVDVMGLTEERYGFLGTKRRTVTTRVTTIGFRNWGEQVSGKDLRGVRRATNLTHENGYDSDVLFEGLDPLESLMAAYHGPLMRLARR